MKKARVYYWIVESFFKKHKKVLIPAALLGAVFFTQVPRIAQYIPEPKPVHRIARVGTYNLYSLPSDIQSQVSQGLTVIEDDGSSKPALAKEWTITDDGKTYIFTLRDDIYWQDGTPVTSYDINYSIPQVLIEKPDEKTVVFKLEEPYAPFPAIVSQPIFKQSESNWLQVIKRTHIIGTSDFKITNMQFNGNSIESMVLESKTEKIRYVFFLTEQAAITAFKLAEVDIIEGLTEPYDLKDWETVTIEKNKDFHRYAVVLFNTQDPNLAEKSVRQALAYTIPNKPENGDRAVSPISPISWAYNPQVKPYNYSLENAQNLLRNKKTDFALEIMTTPSFNTLAEEIKRSWEQLGLTVTIRVSNLPDTSNYQVLLIGQQIPQDPDQYLLWHSTQGTNITKYQSPKVDKLLEDGRKELAFEKRKEIYLDFQRFLLEDSPAAFLHYLDLYTIKRSST